MPAADEIRAIIERDLEQNPAAMELWVRDAGEAVEPEGVALNIAAEARPRAYEGAASFRTPVLASAGAGVSSRERGPS